MKRVFAWLMTVLLALTTAGGCVIVDSRGPTGPPSQSPPAAGETPEQRIARHIFDRVNAERAERGLEPVMWHEDLAAVARQWSEEMAHTGRFEHQDVRELLRSDRLPGLVAVGENIFRSTGPVSAGAIHAGWMRSDGHRANVVNPGWNQLGRRRVLRGGRIDVGDTGVRPNLRRRPAARLGGDAAGGADSAPGTDGPAVPVSRRLRTSGGGIAPPTSPHRTMPAPPRR